ncbi:hypothetical protein NDU88_005152, partial [Pleurodeles waltl]
VQRRRGSRWQVERSPVVRGCSVSSAEDLDYQLGTQGCTCNRDAAVWLRRCPLC